MSDLDPTQTINLEFNRALCGRHGEFLREKWPAGYPTFVVPLIADLLMRPEFSAAWDGPDADKSLPDAERIGKAFDGKPLCCWWAELDTDRLIRGYVESTIGKIARRCEVCGESRPGGPYRFRVHGTATGLHRFKHLCFWCCVFGGPGFTIAPGGKS